MASQLLSAAGYLAILIAPALLALGAWLDKPFLLPGVVLLIFPLARLIFGPVAAGPSPTWTEAVAKALDRLPWLYVAALVTSFAGMLTRLSISEPTLVESVGWMLSLWMTFVFASCVAHELLHRRDRADRFVGHLLTGMIGYPILGYEHSRHHRLPGNTSAAEWPRLDESVWHFALRRLRVDLSETLGRRGLAVAGATRSPTARNLRLGLAATGTTLAAFAVTAGWTAVLVYAVTVAFVTFSLQLVTYMQHWGLGDDNLDDAKTREMAWDSDCRFQAWVTLGLSLHQDHHRNGARPYYAIRLAPDSPRLPAGYVLLLLAVIIPPVWRRVMSPALCYWRAHPMAPLSSGRGVTCVAYYRQSGFRRARDS